jgi:hypothetical protein
MGRKRGVNLENEKKKMQKKCENAENIINTYRENHPDRQTTHITINIHT